MTTPTTRSDVPDVGDEAPDFVLTDQHGVEIRLSSLRGRRNAAIVFYPFAFSGMSAGELREIRDGLKDFQTDDVQVLTISCDSMYTHRTWADAEGSLLPLLSDFWPHGRVSRDYGVFDERVGAPMRGTFLVDLDGRVVWREVNAPGEVRDFVEYRRALAEVRAKAGA